MQKQKITAEILELIQGSDLPEEVKRKVYAEIPKMNEEKQKRFLENIKKAEIKYQKTLHSALDDMQNASFGIVRKAQVHVGKIREQKATAGDKKEIEDIEHLLDEL